MITLPPRANFPRRPGLRVIQSEAVDRSYVIHGLRVASPADTLLSLCRDLHDLDALQAVDAALQQRWVTTTALGSVARLHRRGAPRLRRIVPLADARTESPWETVLREFHRVAGVEVDPQFEVYDEEGFVARGDFRLPGQKVLHEYDGGVHRTVEQHRADLARDRRLHRAGWSRRGYTAVDLTRRPAGILADIDRTLDRPHDPSVLAEWDVILRASSLSRVGHSALVRRLNR